MVLLPHVSHIETEGCGETSDPLFIGLCGNERWTIFAERIRKLDQHVHCIVDEQMIQEFGFCVSACQVGKRGQDLTIAPDFILLRPWPYRLPRRQVIARFSGRSQKNIDIATDACTLNKKRGGVREGRQQ